MSITEPHLNDESEDKSLVLSFKAGQSSAYRDIYERYEGRVRGVCKRMLLCPEDVEEASQETFLRVYQGLGRFNGRYQLGAWVSRIATNVCLDMLRAKKRRPSEPRAVEDLEHEVDETSGHGDPEWSALQRANAESVRSTLESLPPTHRTAIVLRDFEGFSYVDIAHKMSISETQTKALLHRARKNFRKSWTGGAVAGLFLPGRLMSRFRRLPRLDEATGRSPSFVSDVVGSMGNVAASCSAAVQQCGQIAIERFGSTAVALMVTTAAVGAPVVAHSMNKEQPAESAPGALAAQAPDASADGGPTGPLHTRRALVIEPQDEKEEEAAPTEVPEPDVVPEPVPSPTETAPSEPSDDETEPTTPPDDDAGGDPKPKDTETPSPPPPPPPFVAAVGFVGDGSAVPSAVQPSARSEEINCETSRMWQNLDIPVSGNGETYEGKLRLVASSGGGQMRLDVSAGSRSARYSSWGAEPRSTWTREGSEATLQITGEYGPLYDSNPSSANLPPVGRFDAELTLDCTAHSVIAQSVTYYPNQ